MGRKSTLAAGAEGPPVKIQAMDELRDACAAVAERAQFVHVDHDAIPAYAAALPVESTAPTDKQLPTGSRETEAAFWLTLDAINFGSGWFPTLHKRGGRSGYHTIEAGVRERFELDGPWSPTELAKIDAAAIAGALGQHPQHELMDLFARSLNDLGAQVRLEHGGQFADVIDRAGGSAVALATALGRWGSFVDSSTYDELTIPFLKRAQIAAADLARAGVYSPSDLDDLTMFADNLVPHVLRLDGILEFDPSLVDRIERGALIEHRSREEVEIRACALHAVELIAAQRPDTTATGTDELLWNRGQQPHYKASPRHRSRCTAY
jgi:hypothetical protein